MVCRVGEAAADTAELAVRPGLDSTLRADGSGRLAGLAAPRGFTGAGGWGSVALTFWGCQLAVKALWTPVFFGLRMLAPALAVILVLFAAVALTCAKFWRLDRIAGLLLAPYLLWVGFASYLNAGFWFLNHG
jgi:tryptophan-rich sensory protein